MPAPLSSDIERNITASLIQAGYVKQTYKNNTIVNDPSQLPDEMQKLVKAISAGIAFSWIEWQTKQTVIGPFPGIGTLP